MPRVASSASSGAAYTEKFHITPKGLFDEIVRNAEVIIQRSAEEAKRRQSWLAEIDGDDENGAADEPDVAGAGKRADVYGCDLDKFNGHDGQKPKGWSQAVRIAGWLHIDEMRTLLELHYDELHLEKYRAMGKTARKRSSEYTVFSNIAQSHRRKLCQRIQLPESLKAILRCPVHEEKWEKIEEARLAIAKIIEGERLFEVETEADAAELVSALEMSTSQFPDALRGHESYPDGSRVVVEQPPPDLTVREQRAMVCNAVANSVGSVVAIKTRPLSRKPPLDGFAKAILDPTMNVKRISITKTMRAETAESILDKLLLVLWDALFLDACLGWTSRKVSNLHRSETLPLARYFINGLSFGDRPIFDGLCAFCASLLWGGANTNARYGCPIDRHGAKLLDEKGGPLTQAQPPCVLRYSPSLFANEAPAVF